MNQWKITYLLIREIYIHPEKGCFFIKKKGCFSFVMLVLGGERILGRFKVIVSWRIPGKGQSLLCESYDAMGFPYDICIYPFSIDYLYIYIYVSENKYCIHIYVL